LNKQDYAVVHAEHFLVACTVTGDTNELSFWIGSTDSKEFGRTCTVKVYVGNTLLISAVNKEGRGGRTMVWHNFRVRWVATTEYTVLSFVKGNPPGYKMCGLDKINLAGIGFNK
jgi:hypothetical protein